MSTPALVIAGTIEIIKLLQMAQDTAIKIGMTPEQFKAISETVNAGFEARDPANLPNRKEGAA